jgi:hypothetical protein
VNRILRIDTDRWVTGRAIRWASDDARLADMAEAAGRASLTFGYTEFGTDAHEDDENPPLRVTVEGDTCTCGCGSAQQHQEY